MVKPYDTGRYPMLLRLFLATFLLRYSGKPISGVPSPGVIFSKRRPGYVFTWEGDFQTEAAIPQAQDIGSKRWRWAVTRAEMSKYSIRESPARGLSASLIPHRRAVFQAE